MLISSIQLRVARTFLGWSQSALAKRAGVSKDTIRNIENEKSQAQQDTIEKIIQTLQLAGIEFIEKGVKRADSIITLHGQQGFWTFLDDVYATAIHHGSPAQPVEVFLFNVVHQNWLVWMGDQKWAAHVQRMTKIKDLLDVRIIVKENDWHFPAQAYSAYKWVAAHQFNEQSFYAYHDKLAFLTFAQDDVTITVMRQAEFAAGYRTLFLNTWDYVAKTPQQAG